MLAITLILTVFFALLLIYVPVPLRARMESMLHDKIIVKQETQDLWAKIPGNLSYSYQRNLKISDQMFDDKVSKLCSASNVAYPLEYTFDVSRQFTDIEYKPTQSVVNYKESFDFTMTSGTIDDLDTKITTINYGGLSIWH
jgi:hypothetical protein